jgi:hypothetical protein
MDNSEKERVTNALERCIPLLILLGDYVGNKHERCEAIEECRMMLCALHGFDYRQPRSSDLRGDFVPTMNNRRYLGD